MATKNIETYNTISLFSSGLIVISVLSALAANYVAFDAGWQETDLSEKLILSTFISTFLGLLILPAELLSKTKPKPKNFKTV